MPGTILGARDSEESKAGRQKDKKKSNKNYENRVIQWQVYW